jgi:hypothetical protein
MEKPIDKGAAQFAADEIQRLEDRLRALWDKLEGERKYYEDRIKRLEEAGDLMVQHFYTDEPRSEMWEKAKEAKP